MAAAQNKSYGPIVQVRAKALLKAILEVAVENDRSRGIKFNHDWSEQSPPTLTIETTLKDLVLLVHPAFKTNADADKFRRLKTETREVLENLEAFVRILDDHRTLKRGSDRWHFSLRLWGRDCLTDKTQEAGMCFKTVNSRANERSC